MTAEEYEMVFEINRHPRVGVGNDSPAWFKVRRTVWGVLLDGRYIRPPRHRSHIAACRAAGEAINQ